MRVLIAISFLFLSAFSVGQSSELKSCALDSFDLNLTEIKESPFKVNIRIHLKGQVIDFYSNDYKNFTGILTNEITEYKTIKVNKEESSKAVKVIFQKVRLDSITSSFIASEILKSRQDIIPTCSLISSWRRLFFHCDGISFEFKIEDKYSSQSYVCPFGQPKTVEYSETIKANYKLISDTLKLEEKYDDFVGLLEGGKVYSTFGYMFLHKLTDKQAEYWKKDKPRREDYLKSLKDTLDNYLTEEIKKHGDRLIELECSFSYNLIFNKNGKLISIKIPEHQKPKLFDDLEFYFEDMREIRKCKRQIKRIFRKVDLSSFDLKYTVYRTLEFYGGTIQIRDNMIY